MPGGDYGEEESPKLTRASASPPLPELDSARARRARFHEDDDVARLG